MLGLSAEGPKILAFAAERARVAHRPATSGRAPGRAGATTDARESGRHSRGEADRQAQKEPSHSYFSFDGRKSFSTQTSERGGVPAVKAMRRPSG